MIRHSQTIVDLVAHCFLSARWNLWAWSGRVTGVCSDHRSGSSFSPQQKDQELSRTQSQRGIQRRTAQTRGHQRSRTTRQLPVTASLRTSLNSAPPHGPALWCACALQTRAGLERVEWRLSECYLRRNELLSGRQTDGFVLAFRGSPRQSSGRSRSSTEFAGKFLCLYP
jgi:hypothetical protein